MLEPAFQIGKAATLTAMMVASLAKGTTETWARSSKRAAWNNAAWYSTTKDETPKIKLMDASGKEIKTYEGKQSVEADVETVKDGDKTYTLYP